MPIRLNLTYGYLSFYKTDAYPRAISTVIGPIRFFDGSIDHRLHAR